MAMLGRLGQGASGRIIEVESTGQAGMGRGNKLVFIFLLNLKCQLSLLVTPFITFLLEHRPRSFPVYWAAARIFLTSLAFYH